ncbi:hypothetical protein BDN72DRAFT_129098 [Pluteus cervinus]|uniref:Uncharacterized protein n=1 Tax=Pluteus cervinus TaxID=181527 RepID=A0ACD3AMR0_9AGAR|nr:hypothetical protein BDN72DRAFT_129098 [Pluteus cervinus]
MHPMLTSAASCTIPLVDIFLPYSKTTNLTIDPDLIIPHPQKPTRFQNCTSTSRAVSNLPSTSLSLFPRAYQTQSLTDPFLYRDSFTKCLSR